MARGTKRGERGRTRRRDEADEARGMFVSGEEDGFGERRETRRQGGRGWMNEGGGRERGGADAYQGDGELSGGKGGREPERERERESRGWARFCEGSERWLG